jgi:hypothetical protein
MAGTVHVSRQASVNDPSSLQVIDFFVYFIKPRDLSKLRGRLLRIYQGQLRRANRPRAHAVIAAAGRGTAILAVHLYMFSARRYGRAPL